MSDLRARLADALAECFNRNNITVGTHHPAIIADVVLSLPGIAIVELPDKPADKPFWRTSASNSWTGDDYDSFVDATPGSGVVQTAIFQYTVEQARDLAAAFLAAANAAEEKP